MEEGIQVDQVTIVTLDPVQYETINTKLDMLTALLFTFVLVYFAKEIILMMYKTLAAFWRG